MNLVGRCRRNVDTAELTVQVDRLQGLANGLKDHFSWALDHSYNERPGASNLPRPRFFDVPELVEHKLSYLSLNDLMCVQQVNKQLQSTMDASPRLGKSMLQQADPHGFLQTPLEVSSQWHSALSAGL